MDFLVCHPVVKVSIVDGATGYLLQKSGEHLKNEKTVVITKIRNTVHTSGILSFSMYRHSTQPSDKHRDKIQYLLTELMVKNIKKIDLNEMASLVQNGDFELIRSLNETLKLDVDYFGKFYEEIQLRWRNGNYSGELLKDAILALNPDLEVVFLNLDQQRHEAKR